MLNKLDSILLSDNVVDNFYKEYENDEFRNWIISIIPEVERCRNTEQDNPWHIYNCLDHILHSVEYMNTLTKEIGDNDRRMLAYTMFLHDIGKPECKIRRYSKLYQREVDSFFNHNKTGVKIADRVLSQLGFEDAPSRQIKALINEHDMFMFLTLKSGDKYHRVLDKSVVEEGISKLNNVGDGVKLLQYLIWVGKSDNMAQNPKMTGDSLCLIEVMNDILKEQSNIQETHMTL